MKIFLSADIEGTAGVAHWDETEKGKPLYDHFALQMSREVAAACEAAVAAGATDILVKDAHDSARNIDPQLLPQCARIFRGWGRHPYSMMAGLTGDFDGVVFTGYHSAAGSDRNPLAHTMTPSLSLVTLNGQLCCELLMNCLTAAYEGVPVFAVSGDEGLIEFIQSINPNIEGVAVSSGCGNGSISIHPSLATQRIRESFERALRKDPALCRFPLPDSFEMDIRYVHHFDAKRTGFYPGARQIDAHTVRYQSGNYFDVLTFFSFAL